MLLKSKVSTIQTHCPDYPIRCPQRNAWPVIFSLDVGWVTGNPCDVGSELTQCIEDQGSSAQPAAAEQEPFVFKLSMGFVTDHQ